MSVNWVMLDERRGFVRLPGEELVYKSPARTSLAITTPRTYPADIPISMQSNAGVVHLTNQRIVYIPAAPTKEFQSFSAPLLNLHDTHITMPWFGSNSWLAVLQPVPGGNIPSSHAKIEVKLAFNEGGATDFHSNFERIKERLDQAVDVARSSGSMTGSGIGSLAGVNMDTVHLDQLPTYEASGQDPIAPITPRRTREGPPAAIPNADHTLQDGAVETLPRRTTIATEPYEPPPGYEETQQQSLQQELDRRLSG